MIRFAVPVLLAFLITSGVVHAAPDGEELYQKHCSVCHGSDGRGGVGVPLSMKSFINSVPDDYLQATIRHGRPGRIMPAFPASVMRRSMQLSDICDTGQINLP